MWKKILPLLFVGLLAEAQNLSINTFAGGGTIAVGQAATSYPIDQPVAATVDSAGNFYLVVPSWCQVLVVNSSGIVTQVIGNGTCGFSGDYGPEGSAQLNHPQGIAVDSSGNVYIADSGNGLIRQVAFGAISTFAGYYGTSFYNGDNLPATLAGLNQPTGIAVDNSGNLYIADSNDHRIRKVSAGIMTTVAGNGTAGYTGDGGSALAAELNFPEGVAVDASGNLYVADSDNSVIRKVSGGNITTVAGGGNSTADNVPATSASFSTPSGIAVDQAGNLYIVDGATSRIRKVAGGIITTVAGNGTKGFSGDGGSATSAELNLGFGLSMYGVAVDGSGNLYIPDTLNNRVRQVTGGIIGTVAGNGSVDGGDGGAATSAQLASPGGSAVDGSGNLFIADSGACVVRKVAAGTGIMSTVAGINGVCGYNSDNISPTSAELSYPNAVLADSSGNLYISDPGNYRIRKISGGMIATVAGNGTQGSGGDGGSATSAQLGSPQALALDNSGNLYIADASSNSIREVSKGTITTVAGNGTAGYNGDNINATSAELTSPSGVAVDSTGNLYISEGSQACCFVNNARVRKVSGGTITTVAGNGTGGYNGDNINATSAELSFINGVAVDGSGNLYISDGGNSRIRKVSGGIITTIAGNGTSGFSGDSGSATSAELNYPGGIALDNSGNIYITDNNRIRVLSPAALVNVTSTPTGLTVIVDGVSATTPHLFAFPPGSSHTFNALTQAVGTTQYVPVGTFPVNQAYSSTTSTATYNIAFTSQYYLTTTATAGGVISPPSGFYNPGTVVSVSAMAGTGYSFAGFTGALSGIVNPQSITINAAESVTANFTPQTHQVQYNVIPLTSLPAGVTVTAFNNNDQLSGITSSFTPFIATATSFTTQSVPAGLQEVSFVGINDAGLIGGYGATSSSYQAFIGSKLIAGSYTGYNLNASGQLAGVVSSGQNYAAIFTTSGISPSSIAGTSFTAINASGVATGFNSFGQAIYGTPSSIATIPTGSGFTQMYGTGINSTNHICGTGNAGAFSGAFYFNGTTTTAIPLAPGEVAAFVSENGGCINDLNQVVGYSYNSAAVTEAFLWDPVNGTQLVNNLAPSGWNFTNALYINNKSDILAQGTNGSYTGYVLLQNTVSQAVISGQVSVFGVALSGVTITVTGSENTFTTTNASGTYSLTLPSGGSYTIAAGLSGYSFSLPVTFTNLSGNQTANFTGIDAVGLDFYSVSPCRVADTRTGAGFTGQFGPPSVAGGATRTFNILSSPCAAGIPANVAAYSLNFTVVPPTGGPQANLTTWPAGLSTGMPNVSTLNYSGSVVANAAIVPAGANGAINVFVNYPTDVLFDINGYFAPPLSSGLEFYTLTPCRIADTRTGAGFNGQFGPPSIAGGATRTFNLPASSCGVPTTASAYSLNFTVVPPAGGPQANLTTWPATEPNMPNVSTLNYSSSVVANAAIVPAGTNDAINVFVTFPTDVLFDVNGYFAPPLASGLHFYPVTPCRIADTRAGAGFSGQFGPPTMAAESTRTFTIPASSCGIPATAAAYSLNFTVVPPAGGSQANLTTWPAGLASGMPNVSTLNYAGSVVANAAIVPAGTSGAIDVYVNFATDVLFDINGYFAP